MCNHHSNIHNIVRLSLFVVFLTELKVTGKEKEEKAVTVDLINTNQHPHIATETGVHQRMTVQPSVVFAEVSFTWHISKCT